MNFKNILIVAPHADDEILGCGGIISKYSNSTIHVIVVANRYHTDIENRNDYARLEKKFNIKYYNLNYIDEHLDTVSISKLIKKLEERYLAILPDIVLIPFDGDINNDHKVVHNACTIAFRKIQSNQPRELLCYEIPSSTTQGTKPFFPNTYIQLSIEDVSNKWNMLSYYNSEIRDYPNPRSELGLVTYARFRGMECNSEYAEAYISLYKIHG